MKILPTYRYSSQFFEGEHDPVALAFGRAFDLATSQYNHYFFDSFGGRGFHVKALRHFMAVFKAELGDDSRRDDVRRVARAAWCALTAYRKSELFDAVWGREKTRAVVLSCGGDGETVVYMAQPDLVNHRGEEFCELKTFGFEEVPKHVLAQLSVFQLAYPRYTPLVYTFDWRVLPVKATRVEVSQAVRQAVSHELLRELYEFGLENGDEGYGLPITPQVRYSLIQTEGLRGDALLETAKYFDPTPRRYYDEEDYDDEEDEEEDYDDDGGLRGAAPSRAER